MNIRPWIVPLALAALSCGCTRLERLQSLPVITDQELREAGQWTPADAAARELIGAEVGKLGQARPVRRCSVGRKLRGMDETVLTLLGWSYEKCYYYVPEAGSYVFVHREHPASIVSEEWQGRVRPARPVEARFDRGDPLSRRLSEESARRALEEVLPRPVLPAPRREPIELSSLVGTK